MNIVGKSTAKAFVLLSSCIIVASMLLTPALFPVQQSSAGPECNGPLADKYNEVKDRLGDWLGGWLAQGDYESGTWAVYSYSGPDVDPNDPVLAIYCDSQSGTFETHGFLRLKFQHMGDATGFGPLRGDQKLGGNPDDPDNTFTTGFYDNALLEWIGAGDGVLVLKKGASDAFYTPTMGDSDRKAVRSYFQGHGYEIGLMGFPVDDWRESGTGSFQQFEHGWIFHKTGTPNAYSVMSGPIFDKWNGLGRENGQLGYPVADESNTPSNNGKYQQFENGYIYSLSDGRVYQTIGEPDQPPVITVPADMTVEATGEDGRAVTYEASATDDHDEFVGVECDHKSGFTFPVGVTTVTCYATDSIGNQATPKTFTVTVQPQPTNHAPTAKASSAQLSYESGQKVTLTGSGSSDPDTGDSIAKYQWTQKSGPSVTLNGADTATATFTAPTVASDSSLTFELLVTDNHGAASTPASITITLIAPAVPGNLKPLANAGSPQTVKAGDTVTLDGSLSSDPDNNTPLTYQWTASGGITLNGADTARPSLLVPQITSDATYTFTLVVRDSKGAQSDPATVTVTAFAITPSRPEANAGSDRSIESEQIVTLDGSLSTGDQPLQYQWTVPNGVMLIGGTTVNDKAISFIAPKVSSDTPYEFKLVVTDSQGIQSEPAYVTVTAKAAKGGGGIDPVMVYGLIGVAAAAAAIGGIVAVKKTRQRKTDVNIP